MVNGQADKQTSGILCHFSLKAFSAGLFCTPLVNKYAAISFP